MDGIKNKKLTKRWCLSAGLASRTLLLWLVFTVLHVDAIKMNERSDSRFLGTAIWKTFDLFTFGAFEKKTNYTEER